MLPPTYIRPDFIVSLAMFVFIALMVVSNDITLRALLLVPVVLLFTVSKLLYTMDQSKRVDDVIERYKKKMESGKT